MQGLTAKQVRRLALDFTEKLKVLQKFNRETRLAGNDWINYFMIRQKLSHRKVKYTIIARVNGLNKKAVNRFFSSLEKIITENKKKKNNIIPGM